MTGVKKDIRDNKGRFAPGNSAGGRPKGVRHKLGSVFFELLHEDFEKHGMSAIIQTREEKPAEYIRAIASIVPKELIVQAQVAHEEWLDHLENAEGTEASDEASE